MQTGEPLGSGRSADVYAIDDAWALRRYRDGRDATTEAAVMAHLAERGYPVPRVRPSAGDGPLSRADLVMRRLSGPTLLQALRRGAVTPAETGRIVADLMRRLHAVPARVSADPSHRILHLDLHPDNVVLTPDGPVVIDWGTAEEGPPGLDWAMSALIMAQVAEGWGLAPFEAAGVREVLASFLRHRDPAVVLDGSDSGHLAQAVARRAANPTMSEAETAALGPARALVLDLAR
ncbi:MAG TPA: phosphotransferase [Streptomyces sp.]|uniref:phosphotransferase n=1 Tax=Streptomyces sp. TaxID=1931 RepID=UPI002D3E2A3E|nr:phosphotransferase [Streptomyces sp.]HZG02967.1 phosphotransferase [Streptomyces sp.]